ncbi:hypothetical protein GALMADRAFT_231502 [Galerina marginata CBS 339.88]|uniref:Uncharacterized protein n=1 Tax=Galerina marginata (strain CBS 339.88) TaxID=685588 RepID=A0A067SDJ4_GALM3|nr:hypothetical protein GALMADRAFT_231502 [Galerina marginata CBS 339.88]
MSNKATMFANGSQPARMLPVLSTLPLVGAAFENFRCGSGRMVFIGSSVGREQYGEIRTTEVDVATTVRSAR